MLDFTISGSVDVALDFTISGSVDVALDSTISGPIDGAVSIISGLVDGIVSTKSCLVDTNGVIGYSFLIISNNCLYLFSGLTTCFNRSKKILLTDSSLLLKNIFCVSL